MEHSFLLAVPRMHASLATLPQDCLSFWPGLPGMPGESWQPDLPWQGAAAAACLADFERAVRDGISGTPVQAFTAGRAPEGLSPAELKALEALTGASGDTPPSDRRQTAQQTLLLIWLQEQQAMDIAALEASIGEKRSALSALISGKKPALPQACHADESAMPAWGEALAAMLAFLPDMPDPCTLYVNSAAMAQAVLEEASGNAMPHDFSLDAPYGCALMNIRVSWLAALCGRSASERLRRGLEESQWQRGIRLAVPVSAGRRQ